MRQITPFVWLAIGGVFATLCLGKGAVPFAAWLAPIFLLRFVRRSVCLVVHREFHDHDRSNTARGPVIGVNPLWLYVCKGRTLA